MLGRWVLPALLVTLSYCSVAAAEESVLPAFQLRQKEDARMQGSASAPPRYFITLKPSRLEFTRRPGYYEGLPIPEDVAKLDDTLALKSNGVVVMGAGPLTWLNVEVESFRELAGARRYKFVALPGLVVKPLRSVPVQAGMGMLLAFKRKSDAYSDERRRATGFFQISGKF